MKPTSNRSALALAAFMGSAGVAHFAKPEFFDAIVPGWVPGDARLVTHLSGAVELTAAALVALPQTRKLGGWFTAATLVGVFPANIWAAVDGGMHQLEAPYDSAAVAWLRLPLQLPLIWWAMRVANPGTTSTDQPMSEAQSTA
jgi:uncharacterized membrane protein